jgi:serine/threonine-protein kinase
VYDVGKEGNIYYIVMEMMEGDTLSDVIRREAPMSEKRVLEISRQIAAALSAAHKKNIIHRDIKPHNIIFSDDGVAKITDFGIAKAVNSGTIVNTNATVLGSVHYLSPEQARGGFVDAKSDLYSLGIVMYEMLTGTVPFDGENAVSVAMMHINGDVPAPSIANPSVSALMDAIVLKAAARRPEDRFSSADELIAALTNASEGIAILSSGTKKSYGRDDFYAVEHDQRHDDEVEVSSFEDLSENNDDDRAMNNHKNNKKQKNEPASDQKKARRSQILAVVLALVCAVPLSIILLNSCSGTSSKTVDVPNVIGMTEEQAADELDKYGLEYKLGIPAISDEYEEGQVISSDPDAGEKVKKGFTVTLVLSRGTDATTVKMPTFLTQKLREAETMLEAYDLKKGEITYEESDMPEGTIISQDPEPGTVVDVNTKVNFVISQGEEDKGIEVPDLYKKTEKQAKKMLEDLGLRLGKVSKAYSSDVEENLVISQTKEAGTSANEGDSVGITLSMGPEPSAEPVDIPLNIDYDKASNEVFTLTVTVTDNNGLHYVINNESRIKSDGSETVTLSGTGSGTVRVIMDNEIVYEGNADFDTGVLS